MFGRAYGIARSMALYHGVPGRHRKMLRFYGEFLGPGDIGFDVGAHVGSRVRAWRALGARVIAVEPQPDFARILRLFFGRDGDVMIVPKALGAEPGTARLGISTATPTVSSLSTDWIETVATDRSFAKVRWDRSVPVEVITLDELIAAHGEPAFCKIDVEGYELEVLRGLSRPLRALSFEYLPAARDAALACVARLASLGAYEFNWSSGESMRLREPTWLGPDALAARLARLAPRANSGDVYARRRAG
jgi:FkbM family methyltransferase